MNTFRVIEGTIWDIEAETLEEAQNIYEKHFNDEGDDLPMFEIECGSHWFDDDKIFDGQELKDLLSAVVNDTRGTWGDQRSQRLDALHIKLERLVKEEAKQ
jgi:hypothetical protein